MKNGKGKEVKWKGKLVQTNISGYKKSPKKNVVLNTNTSEFIVYKKACAKAKQIQQLKKTVQSQDERMITLERMVLALKEMVEEKDKCQNN